MSKTGQARVLTPEQFAHLLHVIHEHRYPEKNTALVQISFKLGLRVQEETEALSAAQARPSADRRPFQR